MKISNKFKYQYLIAPLILLLIILLVVYTMRYLDSETIVPFLILFAIQTLFYLIFVFVIGRFIKQILGSILLAQGLNFLLFGYMFKIMHWPSGSFQLLLGLVLILLSIPIALFFKGKEKSNFNAQE